MTEGNAIFLVGLILVGVIAAGCAAALVTAVRADSRDGEGGPAKEPSHVQVLVAGKALPALSVVDIDIARRLSASPASCCFVSSLSISIRPPV